MKIWKVIVAVLVIFGAGVVTGGLLVRTRVPAPLPQPVEATGGTAAMLAPGRQQFVQRVRRELDLSSGQLAQVNEIMRESHQRMTKIYEPVSPQAREETRRVRQEIQAILTPKQKKQFNEKFKRRQRDGYEERRDAQPRSETNASIK